MGSCKMSDIEKKVLNDYVSAIGSNKLQNLWQDFLKDTASFLKKVSFENKQALRLKFHNLRSDAQVFGMKHFSIGCAEIETAILEDEKEDVLLSKIKKIKQIFEEQSKQVNAYFEEIQ